MVEFEGTYEFSNDWADYKAMARTYDSHSGYGNDTGVEIKIENSRGTYMEPMLYDIRYTGIWTPQEVDEFVRKQLASAFGAKL